ncbi:MAG: tryptophan-rich sensory protein [Alphaproteobacteria bacterium]|nr:MAG: tryptophan-rich sensory protein [Alphaproteobacteria bacterium]
MTGIASKSQLRMSFLRYALFTVPGVLLLGTLSGQLSGSGYGNPWFDALRKPDLMPPGWVFGAAWTILYILLGLSLAMLLHARGAERRSRALALFAAQLALNFAWSPVFFAFHRIGPALSIIAAMVVGTLALILVAWRIRPLAGLLLYPYLAWLTFAGTLTFQIMTLNPEASTVAPEAGHTDIPL